MEPTLRIASFNAENFYLLLDRASTRAELEAMDEEAYLAQNPSIYNPNKNRGKIAEIARIILEKDYDIVGLIAQGLATLPPAPTTSTGQTATLGTPQTSWLRGAIRTDYLATGGAGTKPGPWRCASACRLPMGCKL